MGRTPRVEFEGAVYHVMCRGNRQEPVFRDKSDNEVFLNALDEACGRCGWRIHAFVLMGNHYHLLLETPHANLVDGMRWLQGTYTKRFNARHKEWGHLFQGRYKALLVDPEGDYFQTVSSYIHLNPARAKCFDLGKEKLSAYPWSSYVLFLHPRKRPEWLDVERTFGCMELLDDSSGRARYEEAMQKRVLETACSETPWDVDERWTKIRRGWYFGSDGFRDRMVEALDDVMDGKRRDSFVGGEVNRHDVLAAGRLFDGSLNRLGLSLSDLSKLKKSDPRKKAMAWIVRKRTCVRNEWIAQSMEMGCVSNVSSFIRQVDEATEGELFELRKVLVQLV
ncbi:MAG: transposase [Kiritimatiellales bacterium]|nr:transposase [Kiritimatiellales bacterium]